jgi:acyl-coenzyme A thioesterase PaaI-like protein
MLLSTGLAYGCAFVLGLVLLLHVFGVRKKQQQQKPEERELVLSAMKALTDKKQGWDRFLSRYCDPLDLLRSADDAPLVGYLINGEKKNTTVHTSHLITLVDVLTTVALAKKTGLPGVSSNLSFVFHHNRKTKSDKQTGTVDVCKYEAHIVKAGKYLAVTRLDLYSATGDFIGHGTHTKFVQMPFPASLGVSVMKWLHRRDLIGSLTVVWIADKQINVGGKSVTPSNYDMDLRKDGRLVLRKEFSNLSVKIRIAHGGFIAHAIHTFVTRDAKFASAERMSHMSVEYLAPLIIRGDSSMVLLKSRWLSDHNCVVEVHDVKRKNKLYASASICFYHD